MAENGSLQGTKETTSPARAEPTWGGTFYTPRVDVYEDANELVFQCDMPGVKPDELDVRYENGELTLLGKARQRQEGANYRQWEYGVGDFYRNFTVSAEVDPAQITAEYKFGVLTVRLPKKEEVRPRRIAVKAE
jgi:HSP20 family protein